VENRLVSFVNLLHPVFTRAIQWKGNIECTPFALDAFNPNAAAVRLDDVL
jgi:hypothetical protein